VYDPSKHTLSISTHDNPGHDSTPFKLRTGEALSLHVFIDAGLLEVVANSRASIAASTKLPQIASDDAIRALGTVELATFEAWSLGSIWV
jgi:hypothetical protein